MKSLVIVESPAKCNKIQSYLGSSYIVKASYGHIMGLDKKKGINAIDLNNNYKPSYVLLDEKKKYINEIKKIANSCLEVIIASDLDREGEAIAYHLIKFLKLDINTTKRIVFNEITKKSIQDAISNPRKLDINLFYSAQARQILDYIIGFDISPVLWKFIRNNLSAGRCQSPALNMIYEKEKEIDKFKSSTYFSIDGTFLDESNNKFIGNSKDIIDTKNEAYTILENFKYCVFKFKDKGNYSKSISKPSSPYITSTIQQDSSNKFGISPKQTMISLQKLYESGKITYMRTDSKTISEECSNNIKNYINNNYGNNYYKNRIFKNDVKNTQEAHECIRPVDINNSTVDSDEFSNNEVKLYNLIWKRTIASQMADMVTDVFKINIENNYNNIIFETLFNKTIFLGYGIIYGIQEINEIDNLINNINFNEKLRYENINIQEKNTTHSPRYTEATIIKDLEKKGIGRPSTFSSIVDTLYKREYIIKDSKKGIKKDILNLTLNYNENKINEDYKKININTETNKIFITELGKIVNNFMLENFSNIINYEFTSNLENNLDDVAKGNYNWISLIDKIYKIFHPTVSHLNSLESTKTFEWKSKNQKTSIGINPTNNKNIYCYKNKFGNVVQEGDNDNIKYVNLPSTINIENITITECLEFLKYPKILGEIDNIKVLMCISNNGYYIKYNNNNYSIINENTNLEEIKTIIENKNKNIIKNFSENISVRNGEYGPYIIKIGKKNIIRKLPEIYHNDPEKITLIECKKILEKTKKKYIFNK